MILKKGANISQKSLPLLLDKIQIQRLQKEENGCKKIGASPTDHKFYPLSFLEVSVT